MTKMKKVVAVVLAFLMIFSSVSVMAFADFDLATSDGTTLTVAAEIGKNVKGTWTAVDKVVRGDEVTARVSMGTDYYSNSSQLLFFYDKSFFNIDGIANVLSVNNAVFSANSYCITSANANIAQGLINKGLVTAEYLANHGFVLVNLVANNGTQNFKYDTAAWQFAITLKVNDDATGTGNFFILDSTVQNTANPKGVVNVPKGPQGGTVSDNYNMYYWNATFNGCTDSVTVSSTTTLDPNGGTWTEDGSTEPKELTGITGEALTVPALTNGNKTLHGWYDASITNPTKADCIDLDSFDEFSDVTYMAYWIEKVNITFNLAGGNIAGSTDDITVAVTPGYDWGDDHTDPAEPTREGYDFRGWSTNPNASAQAEATNVFPATYPAAAATYYAIWAKKVTLTFKDTFAGTDIGTITGYAGDAVTESAPAIPPHTGYYAVTDNYIPVLPAVFPAEDATYNAYYEPIEKMVTFNIMNGTEVYETVNRGVSYGSKIVAKDTKIAKAPEGMRIIGWYTDPACQNEFDYNTTMGSSPLTLYAYLDEAQYTVTFDANGGKWADESEEKTADVAYLGTITYPTENPTRAGYEFTGWEPQMDVLDVAEDITLVASWQLKQYTVTYVVGGAVYESYTATIGEDFDVPEDPYKAKAAFIGWDLCTDPTDYTSGDGETDDFPATVTGDITYVALFTAKVSLVVYKDSTAAETYFTIDREVSPGGIILPAGASLFTVPEGYELVGWYTDNTWANTSKFDHSSVMGTDPVELYAYLKEKTYTVTFDANNGAWADSDTKKTFDVAYLGTITAPATDPVREGYTFLGWDPEVDILSNEADLTIKAVWELNAHFAKFYDGDKLVAEFEIDYGEEIDEPAEEPFKAGYTFKGWDADNNGTADDLTELTMPDADLILKAVWEEITTPVAVTVKWNANGGAFADTTTVKSEAGVYFLNDTVTVYGENPSKDGYNFKGWAATSDATAAAATLTVDDYVEAVEAGSLVNVKTFYAVYEVQSFVPVKFYVPTRDTTSAVGAGYGTLTANIADYTLLETNNSCKAGDAVPAVTGDPSILYYTFLGWSTDGTAANIIGTDAVIPAGGASYYAVYEREAVYLISKTDATTHLPTSSIDRRGNAIGTWSTLFTEANFNTSKYVNSTSCNLWFVHVPSGSLRNATPYTTKYFDVNGDGAITVTKGTGGWGTGTIITVTDKVTGAVVEKFYVVIYGDVDGNGTINSTDANNVYNAYKKLNSANWSTKGTYDFVKIYAANLNTPARVTTINSADQLAIINVFKGIKVLDPLTGNISDPPTA